MLEGSFDSLEGSEEPEILKIITQLRQEGRLDSIE
jgi:hypothetical protein